MSQTYSISFTTEKQLHLDACYYTILVDAGIVVLCELDGTAVSTICNLSDWYSTQPECPHIGETVYARSYWDPRRQDGHNGVTILTTLIHSHMKPVIYKK